MKKVTLMAVGDTGPFVEPPEKLFEAVRDVLSTADLRFAQVERTFSTRGVYQEISFGRHSRVNPSLAKVYSAVGFDVVSLASNHTGDWGIEPVVDTIKYLREQGIATIGTGSNIKEARTPAILEKKGLRIAFLGYSSVLLPQYWATESRPGCAPVRAYTYYRPYEYQPGAPPLIYSVADREDLAAMVEDIKNVRNKVDVVICSFHWGVHLLPRYIADYQIEVGHAAIDAGCDLILGHHAHLLKGIEVYHGKPCLYSLGNFALCSPLKTPNAKPMCAPEGKFTLSEVYDIATGPGHMYRHNDYFNYSMITKVELGEKGEVNLTLLPVYNENAEKPIVLRQEDPRFTEVVRLIEWSSEPFGTKFELKDGVVHVLT
jgi:poly-gamma-glutamate capsule biosynthesis protein CapA/YwtB (metallophosphatase superfamily)